MEVKGTDFVLYLVSDIERASRFYRETLGLKQELYSAEHNWAEFNCGNVTLALRGGQNELGMKGCIALAIDNIQEAHEELKTKNANLVGTPEIYSCCSHIEVLDPDGNLVMLHKRADGTFA